MFMIKPITHPLFQVRALADAIVHHCNHQSINRGCPEIVNEELAKMDQDPTLEMDKAYEVMKNNINASIADRWCGGLPPNGIAIYIEGPFAVFRQDYHSSDESTLQPQVKRIPLFEYQVFCQLEYGNFIEVDTIGELTQLIKRKTGEAANQIRRYVAAHCHPRIADSKVAIDIVAETKEYLARRSHTLTTPQPMTSMLHSARYSNNGYMRAYVNLELDRTFLFKCHSVECTFNRDERIDTLNALGFQGISNSAYKFEQLVEWMLEGKYPSIETGVPNV